MARLLCDETGCACGPEPCKYGYEAVLAVMAEPDDTPCDMDDSVSVSYRYLDLLVSRANTHCATCTCHN